MSPTLAGVVGAGLVGAYVPLLLRQIAHGAIQVGHLGVNPILVRRRDRPLTFRIVAVAFSVMVASLLTACALLVGRGLP